MRWNKLNCEVSHLKIKEGKDPEKRVKLFFKDKGYQVIKLEDIGSKRYGQENLEEYLPFISDILEDRKGMPDFIVFRLFQEVVINEYVKGIDSAAEKVIRPKTEIADYMNEWFLVEVKSDKSSYGLSISQINWFVNHQEYPLKIIICEEKE